MHQSIGVIENIILQSQYEADQREGHQHDQHHEDLFRGGRHQNSGKYLNICSLFHILNTVNPLYLSLSIIL